MLRVLSSAVVLLLMAAGIAVFVTSQLVFTPLLDEGEAEGDGIVFEVTPGESIQRVANRLESQRLIRSARALAIFSRLRPGMGTIQVGEYLVSPTMSPKEILDLFISGKSITYPVTIQEGLNVFEIADALEARGLVKKAEFIELANDQETIRRLLGEPLPSLEGYLFPDTYTFTKYTGGQKIIKTMVDAFLKVYSETITDETVWTRHQIVTLASLIEKETGAPEERRRISSVFHNRLKKKMRLQSDPTILYGIWLQTGERLRNITRKDITAHTKYNTYTVNGLPFGPIANPGRESLLAAVRPEESEYLFFVSRNDGTHYFSKSYKEHGEAVRRFQLDPAARAGKSWRDLSKKKNK